MRRRRFLEGALSAAVVGSCSLAGCSAIGNGDGTGADGPSGSPTGSGDARTTPGTAHGDDSTPVGGRFAFDGHAAGWMGRTPESIAGAVNPTLRVAPGRLYEVTWKNVDGNPHNFVVRDSGGNAVLVTDTVVTEGETQVTRFTATAAMSTYLCRIHSSTMYGRVAIGD